MGKKKPQKPSKSTVDLVWQREEGRCAMCGTWLVRERTGSWSIHHRTGRQMGGSSELWVNLPGNLVLLCGSALTGCHAFVGSHVEHSEERGFLVRRGVRRPSHIPIAHFLRGVVYLNDRGTTTKVPAED